MTALLVQGVISSTMIVVLYSQSSLETTFLYLSGALTVLWLFSGFFFFIPVAIARWKYAERYATESFWRIPGGKPGALAVAVIGSVGTAAGIYCTYTLPFSADIPAGDWMWNVGMVTGGFLIGADCGCTATEVTRVIDAGLAAGARNPRRTTPRTSPASPGRDAA